MARSSTTKGVRMSDNLEGDGGSRQVLAEDGGALLE